MEYINIQDLEKLNIRVGKIKAVERHPDAEGRYILLIDLGPVERDMQLVATLSNYSIQELLGKQVLFVENVKPKVIDGIESQGALLVTQKEKQPIIVVPEKEVYTGVKARFIDE